MTASASTHSDASRLPPTGLSQVPLQKYVVPLGESSRSGHPTRFWAGRVYHVPEAMDWLIGAKCAKAISRLIWEGAHHRGDGPFEMFHAELRRKTGAGNSTISEALWRIKKLGWATIKKGGRRPNYKERRYIPHANQYDFHWNKIHADLARAEVQMRTEPERSDITARWNRVRAGAPISPLLLQRTVPVSGTTETSSSLLSLSHFKRLLQPTCHKFPVSELPKRTLIPTTLHGLEHLELYEEDLPWWSERMTSQGGGRGHPQRRCSST